MVLAIINNKNKFNNNIYITFYYYIHNLPFIRPISYLHFMNYINIFFKKIFRFYQIIINNMRICFKKTVFFQEICVFSYLF